MVCLPVVEHGQKLRDSVLALHHEALTVLKNRQRLGHRQPPALRESRQRLAAMDENEFRKQITSVLMDGDYAVLLDNVTGPFHSQSMAGMLTATTWSDRKVGSNVMVKVPSRAVWWATGNNMQLGADIARRSLVIRLDAKVENPEERFHHADLLTWVVRERARLVVAAVSILRGYIAADRPGHRPAWGTYDSWAALIPGAIRWLGLADPLTARPSAA
jgi:putative DNA primase/helicase